MATTKKQPKKRAPQQPKKQKPLTVQQRVILVARHSAGVCVRVYKRAERRVKNFLHRRPHRSFRRTDTRDMPKVTALPGNIFFTAEVFATIKQNWRPYVVFLILYTAMFTVIAGIITQDNYNAITDSVKSVGPSLAGGSLDKVSETFSLVGAVVTIQLGEQLSEVQQVYLVILCLYSWLCIVWFLRHRLAGVNVKARDAVYSAGSPILATLIVALVGLVQLLPGALAMMAYWAGATAEVIPSGISSMVLGIAAGLVVVLSLYWVTSTLLGLVIVTIPGTYPFRALSMAGDVVVGRRRSLLLRLLWLIFMIVLVALFVLIPIILLADALPWKWLPLVPFTVQLLSGASLIFAATYIYMLYRKMIDDPAATE